jgi:hypothetical protein
MCTVCYNLVSHTHTHTHTHTYTPHSLAHIAAFVMLALQGKAVLLDDMYEIPSDEQQQSTAGEPESEAPEPPKVVPFAAHRKGTADAQSTAGASAAAASASAASGIAKSQSEDEDTFEDSAAVAKRNKGGKKGGRFGKLLGGLRPKSVFGGDKVCLQWLNR